MKAHSATFAWVCLFVAPVACSFLWYSDLFCQEDPQQNFQSLLKGEMQGELVSVTITGHERTVELTDPASLEYLANAFHRAELEGHIPPQHHGGVPYYADLRFKAKRPIRLIFVVPDRLDGVSIGFPSGSVNDPIYYWVPLTNPVPASVRAVLAELAQG
jgi:hypothetical protein